MQRREAILALAALGAMPLAVEAQQAAKPARIGLLTANLARTANLREAFYQGMRDLGYVEGRNFVMEIRDAGGKLERFSALAAELVSLKVDVIVVGGTPQALAAKHATRNIPIVFSFAWMQPRSWPNEEASSITAPHFPSKGVALTL